MPDEMKNAHIHADGDRRKDNYRVWCCSGGGYSAGLFIIGLGGFFLAREMGWISYDFPFWPLVIIAAGSWLIIKRF